MVPDLETRLRPGMSRDEILELLGPPESAGDNLLIYELGVSGYGVDFDHYMLEFDDDGALVRYWWSHG